MPADRMTIAARIREGWSWGKHIARVLRDFARDVVECLFGRDPEATGERLQRELAELEAELKRRKSVAK